MKSQADKTEVTLVTDSSLKSAYFISQMKWLNKTHKIADNQNLPCFMISDNKEVMIAFHEKDNNEKDDSKKKYRTAAIWTNYTAFVNILQVLFSKLV